MKKKVIIIVIILFLCVVVSGVVLFINKNNSNNYKYDNATEQRYLYEASYISYINMNTANEVTWLENKDDIYVETINSNVMTSIKAFFRTDILDTISLDKNGKLYYGSTENEYNEIKLDSSINRIGFLYGKTSTCKSFGLIVAEGTKTYVIKYDNDQNKYVVIDELDNYIKNNIAYIPVCYESQSKTKLPLLEIDYNGNIKFSDKNNLIFGSKQPIKSSYVIYADNNGVEKYYVISLDNNLYIIDKEDNKYKSVAKVIGVEEQPGILTVNLDNSEKLVFNITKTIY